MKPATALLWAIWRQHRSTIAAIGAVTALAHLLDFFEPPDVVTESDPLTVLLAMTAFFLLLAVFNYTETSGERAMGGFPRRLFTLPVTSLGLVAVPMLAGIASIELLYLLWMGPLSKVGPASPFVAELFAAMIVFYLWALWTLERAGAMKLLALGAIVSALFAIGLLPSFPPAPPPLWRSEIVLGSFVAATAVAAFLLSWRHVSRLRTGEARGDRAASLAGWIAEAAPTRQHAFASPMAAHFWYEWRSSGLVLPAIIAGQFVFGILPMSWMAREDAAGTFRLLLLALASPIVLAAPVAVAFSKPALWTEELGVPAFVAVRPLSSADLVVIKVKVAALSVAIAWALTLLFVTMWLSLWGNGESLNRLALQLWAFHGQSVAAVFGIGVLVVLAAMFMTWRFLVSRLWSGLSGRRLLFVGSVAFIPILVMAGIVLEGQSFPGWLFDDPARMALFAWFAALALIAKSWMAAYTWRNVPRSYLRAYLVIWLAGTMSILALGLVVWGVSRIYQPMDSLRVQSVVILIALLAMPLARVGLAPATLARNRHRS